MADPLWAQGGEYPARIDRTFITELWDAGVLRLTACRVSERAAGANFTVDITGGRAVVAGTSDPDQGNYMVPATATTGTTVSSTPSPGQTRLDLVVLEVRDDAEDSGGVTDWRFRVVPGTPTTGTAVAPATPANCLALATIGPISNATTAITDGMITDVRVLAGRREEPGTIKHRADTRVPSGWLECNGQEVSRSTYADLFATIGESYGAGDGASTFRLPDFRGRVAVPQGSAAQVDAIGETGGAYTHLLSTSEIPPHNHPGSTVNPPATNVTTSQGTFGLGGGGGSTSVTGVPAGGWALQPGLPARVDIASAAVTVASQGGGSAHNNMQPYQVVGCAVIRT